MKHEFKHAAIDQKGCNLCHKPVWNEHPGKAKGFELREKMPQLCVNCHDGIINQKRVHSPVASGNCTACHSPHSSPYKKLLITEKKKICLNCHNKSLSKDNKPVINILQLVSTKKYLHPVLENAGCTPCHLQHGSDFPKFLNAAFPTGNYVVAVRDSFELCWQCHDSDLLEKEITSTATNFRNGDKNLHFQHMHGDKARNCNVCHNVHGSDNPHLIAEKVPFGKWELPITYIASDSGGTCKSGCHSLKRYVR
jgi:predicted CXXCH cytochrome family protein